MWGDSAQGYSPSRLPVLDPCQGSTRRSEDFSRTVGTRGTPVKVNSPEIGSPYRVVVVGAPVKVRYLVSWLAD